MPSKAERLAELRALRAAGKTGFDSYKVQEAESIYDTVDDEGYKNVVRQRLDQDDFVVDDNGEGYADDGREDWQDERQAHDSESEEDAPRAGKNVKRKREEADRQGKLDKGINKYFNQKPVATAPKSRPARTAEEDVFMAGLLEEVDVNIPTKTPPRGKAVKSDDRRKTRVLSPPPTSSSQAHVSADDVDMSAIDNVTERLQIMSSPPTESPSIGKSRKTRVLSPPPTSSSQAHVSPDDVDMRAIDNVTERLQIMSSPPTESPSIGKIQAKHTLEDDGTLRFFWTDYTEVNGSLCLFGKVKNRTEDTFVSAFVKVDNILRKLYFLPRERKYKNGRDTEEVGMADVYEEVDDIMSQIKVKMHKIKQCSRKYAFELPDIPKKADYLKLLYPYDKPALPMDKKGETFSHVFGTNTALFEQFVLWKNVMGPCWLSIKGGNFNAVTNASWCKLELQVVNPSDISTLGDTDNLDAPPLTLMSLAIRTTMNAKENKNEILVASARFYDNVSLADTRSPEKIPSQTFTVMRPNGEYPVGFKMDAEKHRGKIKMEKSEASLLSVLLAIIQKHDPDAIIGHQLDNVDLNVLLTRLRDRKTPGWHRIGRLKRNNWPKNFGKGQSSFFVERQLAAGRLLCDIANDMGKSIMAGCQSWSLDEMCRLYLGGENKRTEIDSEKALAMAESRVGLMNYVKFCEADTYFIAALALKRQLLPLTKVLTNLAGNSWARTLSGTRAERNEYILLHEFHRSKYICPDKVYGRGASDKKLDETKHHHGEDGADAKKKDKYKGGLVFEPEKGLYDKFVLVMDFNSLYPSIIQEFNICFTTVDRSDIGQDYEKVPEVPSDTATKGILPRLIRTLVARRREVKKLMKSKSATEDQLQTWDVKQMALKLTANSMYGCLGYDKSRFYARPLAALTTSKGREILSSTKDLAESTHALRVIYGDTDSVMVNTNQDNILEAVKLGNEFKKGVNERYELLEIEIDNIFKRLLLHAKKKYAAINMVDADGKWTEKMEVKGLDMKRREYCQLSKDTSQDLLNFLLSGEDPEQVVSQIHDYLRALGTKMRQGEIPTHKYTIYTQLGKSPTEYPNGNSMPSVQVALRLMAKGKSVKAKDVMSFVICGNNSGSAENAAKNARPLDEVVRAGSELAPDVDYYLHKQILPPVERLCAPVSGTNVSLLAECLGLDTSKYRVSDAAKSAEQGNQITTLESQVPDHIRFKDCNALDLCCLECRRHFEYRGLNHSPPSEEVPEVPHGLLNNNGLSCPHTGCNRSMSTLTLSSQLDSQIRKHTAKYYDAWLVCDDPACGMRTRQMSVHGRRCLGPQGLAYGCAGRMKFEYSEKSLYNQLLYFQSLFDVDKSVEKLAAGGMKMEESEKLKIAAGMNRGRFGVCWAVVKGYLDRSGWGWVNMDSLFGFALKSMP